MCRDGNAVVQGQVLVHPTPAHKIEIVAGLLRSYGRSVLN
jgi:hypothetical protein